MSDFTALKAISMALLVSLSGTLDDALAQAPEPIEHRIGVILAESGNASFIGQPQRRLLQELLSSPEFPEVHEAGLTLRFIDSRGESALALKAYREFASDPSVIAVIGPSTSAETLRLAEATREQRLPVLSLAASQSIVEEEFPDGSVEPRKWIFKFAPSNELAAARISDDILWDGQRRRVFLLYAGDAFGRNGAEVLKTRLHDAEQDVLFVEFPIGNKFVPFRYALKVPHYVDAVVIWGTSPGPEMLIQALRSYENRAQIYLSHANASESFIERSDGAAEGALVAGSRVLVEPSLLRPSDPGDAAVLRYQDFWISRFPGKPSPFAAHAYDALLAIAMVVRRSDANVSRDSIREGLEQLGDYLGATGLFRFSPTDHAGLSEEALSLFRISRGRLESRRDLKTQIAEISPTHRADANWIRSVVVFEGGSIDSNIVRLYRFLYDHGALPLRWSTLGEGETIESNLLKNNSLFRVYPRSMSELLREFNPDNPELVIRPGRPIVVPDIHFEEHQYTTPIYLGERTLEEEAVRRNLYRDRDGKSSRRLLAEDDEKLAKLHRANPRLKDVGPQSRSMGRVLFPADGFRIELLLPSGSTDEYRELMEAVGSDVIIEQLGLAKAMARSVSQPEVNPGSEEVEVESPAESWNCPDPMNTQIRDHLTAIRYRLPPAYFDRASQDARVFILDSFPKLSARQRVYANYQRDAYKLMRDDGDLDAREREFLSEQRSAAEPSIDDATAKALEEELSIRDFLDVYHLLEHREFRDHLITGELAKETPDQPISSEDEHGLHVAGIIGARCNDFGISGIFPNVRIEAFEVDPRISGWIDPAIYAYDCPSVPCILNASFTTGEDERSQAPAAALKRKILDWNQALLVIAAAGDSGESDGGASFGAAIDAGGECSRIPACLGDQPNVITVTAFSGENQENLLPIADFSASGKRTVSMAAPGTAVLSSVTGDKFAKKTGTSQSTAFVTGAAVLLQALNDQLQVHQLRQRLLYTADLDLNYQRKVYFGKLNVLRAIEYHNEDVVNNGGASDLRGLIKRKPPSYVLYLYKNGNMNQTVKDVRVNRVRRIFKQPGKPDRWTVVYQDLSDEKRLQVARDVTFYPNNARGYISTERLEKTFQLETCSDDATLDRIEVPVRNRVRSLCPEDERITLPIQLDQIRDLIIRADAS